MRQALADQERSDLHLGRIGGELDDVTVLGACGDAEGTCAEHTRDTVDADAMQGVDDGRHARVVLVVVGVLGPFGEGKKQGGELVGAGDFVVVVHGDALIALLSSRSISQPVPSVFLLDLDALRRNDTVFVLTSNERSVGEIISTRTPKEDIFAIRGASETGRLEAQVGGAWADVRL